SFEERLHLAQEAATRSVERPAERKRGHPEWHFPKAKGLCFSGVERRGPQRRTYYAAVVPRGLARRWFSSPSATLLSVCLKCRRIRDLWPREVPFLTVPYW